MGNNRKKRKIRIRQRERDDKKSRSLRKKILSHFTGFRIFLYIVFCTCLCFCVDTLRKHYLIKENGNHVKGYVYKISNNGKTDCWHYYFNQNGQKYFGISHSTYNLKIGDAIDVVYYTDNPSVNASAKDLYE